MKIIVKDYNILIAKRLTAILVAVVFVLGMMYMPVEIYAGETNAAGDAIVTDTTGTSDGAAAPETEPAGADEEGVAPETDAGTVVEATTGTEEPAVESEETSTEVVEELNDALTVLIALSIKGRSGEADLITFLQVTQGEVFRVDEHRIATSPHPIQLSSGDTGIGMVAIAEEKDGID